MYGSDTTTTTWDGFDPAATTSDLHGATTLLRDPLGAVAMQDGTYAAQWILSDQRNATATADATGHITDLVNYADFGTPEYESTGWGSLVGNDQQPGDPTLGLDHYYARDYDTTTGSWIQPDQWRGLLVRPQSLNRHAYIENTPVSFTDHLGYVIKAMAMSDGGRTATAKVLGKSLAKTVIAKTSTRLNQDAARTTWSKFIKSLPKQIVKSPLTRSRSLLSAVHRTGITDKCSVFEPVCIRPGGRDTVYCSDNTLGTIAPAICTMDYRPSTIASKAIDVLLAGVPVGWILTRSLRLLLEAKALTRAATTAVKGERVVDDVATPGSWQTVSESMSQRAASYQTQITGRPASQSYLVNGVKFDGYAGGVLQDAKGPGYAQFVKDGAFVGWFNGAEALVNQARRQTAAAQGAPVTWYVAESSAAVAMRNLLADQGITGINIVHQAAN